MDSTRKGTETLAEAAQRLLAKLNERKERPPAEKAGEIRTDNVIEFPRDWREEGPGSSSSPPRTSRPNCRASWGLERVKR